MKTKRLIELLQKADPSGELECCIGNADIHYVERMEAYWDGRLQVLQRDESNPYYNIVGAKYTCKGDKVKIHPLSIHDAIENDPDLPIDYSELGESWREEYRKRDDDYRAEVKRIIESVRKEQ
jgi:hypothetical protein